MHKNEEFILPDGNWQILADAKKAGTSSLGDVANKIVLEPSTGCVLKLK